MKPITNENYNLADSSIEYINIEYINAEEIRKKINDSLSPLIHETLAQYGYSKSRDDLEIKLPCALKVHENTYQAFHMIEQIYTKDPKTIAEVLDGVFSFDYSNKFPLYILLDIMYLLCSTNQVPLDDNKKQLYEQIIEKARKLNYPSEYPSNWHINPKFLLAFNNFLNARYDSICFISNAAKQTHYKREKGQQPIYYNSTIETYNRIFEKAPYSSQKQNREETALSYASEQFLEYDFERHPELECNKNIYMLTLEINTYYANYALMDKDFCSYFLFKEQEQELCQKYDTLRRKVIQKANIAFPQIFFPYLSDKDLFTFSLKEEYPWNTNEHLKNLKKELNSIYIQLNNYRENRKNLQIGFGEAIQDFEFLKCIHCFASAAAYYHTHAKSEIIQTLTTIYMNTPPSFIDNILQRKKISEETLKKYLNQLSFLELQDFIAATDEITYKSIQKVFKDKIKINP